MNSVCSQTLLILNYQVLVLIMAIKRDAHSEAISSPPPSPLNTLSPSMSTLASKIISDISNHGDEINGLRS